MSSEQTHFLFQITNPTPQTAAEGCLPLSGRDFPVVFRRNPRARQYVMRLRTDGTVAVTLPGRGSKAEAWRFVRSRTGWIERQWSKLQARPVVPKTWPPGTEILLRGEAFPLEVVHEGGSHLLRIGSESIRLRQPGENLRTVAEALLRKLAARELPGRVDELAAREGVSIREVTVRNQSSRWGSCSVAGRISLNWRLIQMPPAVRDYIILHELMHRREMNHSARYWQEVARVCPDYPEHERWIKTHAARLGM
ncbi:MAG: SprT family zinc-dependent metalloprotease [Candidatus Methylacidiphilales bacterium]|nr:SprT family zinc-dependent metalloprotease [Candidatus Methylacidiphilales bacterium]